VICAFGTALLQVVFRSLFKNDLLKKSMDQKKVFLEIGTKYKLEKKIAKNTKRMRDIASLSAISRFRIVYSSLEHEGSDKGD